MSRTTLFVSLLISAAAHAGPAANTPELKGFWDAVYTVKPYAEHATCQFDSEAPRKCKDLGDDAGHVPGECLQYLSWETPDTLICPSVCNNQSPVKIEHGVVTFDIDYVGPSPGGYSGDPDHYSDRFKETRHVEVSLSRGKVSMNQYANTKRHVGLDFTVPITPAIKGAHRDGQHVTTVYFDRLQVKGETDQNAGKCDAGGNSTADVGRTGMLELELIAHGHDAGDDNNVKCEAFLYGPDYKKGQSCGVDTPDYSSGGSSGGGDGGSHGGGGSRQCKSQCRDVAYQCRKSCRSDASCTRQCGDNENSCLHGC